MSRRTLRDVTIVIPVKDRKVLIEECLDSAGAQTTLPGRIIVVDNGSTDGTPDAVRDWARKHPEIITDLFFEPRPGASAARNRGLQEVSTEFVLFFDSDDRMHPDLLLRAREAIGEADLVHWQCEVTELDGRSHLKPFHTRRMIERQFYNCILSTQSYMARTELIRRAGAWQPEAAVWNDWEIGIRLLLLNPVIAHLPQTLVSIIARENSITGRKFSHRTGDWENTLDIVERDILDSRLDDDEKRRMLLMLIYRRVILAATYAREGRKDEGLRLLRQALDNKKISRSGKLWLKFIYLYTALGGRGAYYLWI